MLTLKDFMIKEVVSVKADTPIFDAVELMRKNDVTGLPVVDGDNDLVGVITEKDVLRLLFADEQEKNKTVDFFMTRPAVSFCENESLWSVCDLMIVNYFRRVPVVSRKGKLVGIISRPDIIDYIIDKRRRNTRVKSEDNLITPAI